MSKKKFFKDLKVKSSCNENWDEMSGNDQVRFCSHCDKSVNNLSEMTQKEAKQLVKDSNGNLCVRYIQDPKTQAPVFADKLYKITRRTGIAAGVLGASLAASSVTYAQGGTITGFTKDSAQVTESSKSNSQKAQKILKGTGTISGTITDMTGAVVPGAKIQINKKGFSRIVTSDDVGSYKTVNIPPGNYEIKVIAQNFQVHKADIVIIKENENTSLNAKMLPKIASVTMGGIAMVRVIKNPLIRAVSDNKIKKVRSLIARGVDVNALEKGYNSRTALHTAVWENNLQIVQVLINAGADVNVLDEDGNSPLMILSEDTSVEIVKFLIQHGANLDLQSNETKSTALINAAMEDNFKAMRVLIEAGANVNLRDAEGDSAFDLVSDEKIEQLLIAYGAEQETPDEN